MDRLTRAGFRVAHDISTLLMVNDNHLRKRFSRIIITISVPKINLYNLTLPSNDFLLSFFLQITNVFILNVQGQTAKRT